MFHEFKALFLKKWYVAYCVLLLAVFIKQFLDNAVLVDSTEYLNSTSNWLKTGFPDSCASSCDHWLHQTRRTIGYPLLLMVLNGIPWLVLIVQIAIAAWIPLLLTRVAVAMDLDEKATNTAGWLMVLYPLQFYYTGLLMPEIWCQFFIVLAVLAYLKKYWFALGIWVLVLVALKPVFIILLLFLIVLFRKDPKKRWALLLPLLFVVIISQWNYRQTGVRHYSSIAVENGFEYNMKAILNKTMSEASLIDFQHQSDSMLNHMGFKQRYHWMKNLTRDALIEFPVVYAGLHLKGSLLALIDPGRYDLVAFFKIKNTTGWMQVKNQSKWKQIVGSQPIWVLTYMGIFAFLAACKLFLVLNAFFRNRKKWQFYFLLFILFIGVTGPVGSARYLFPFMPIIALMAAEGWHNIIKMYGKNSSH